MVRLVRWETAPLFPLIAVKEIPALPYNIKKGDLGGWIEKYDNLKGDDACVFENAC
jgi:hypothetical protein